MLVNKSDFLISVFFVFFATLVAIGLLDFKIWGQVEDYRSTYLSNGGFFFSPHVLRYLVIHPVYEFSDIFNFDENAVYSWYVLLAASLTSKVWASVRRCYLRPQPSFSFLVVLPFVILFFINGRFIFGLLGLSLILRCIVGVEKARMSTSQVLMLFISFLLVSVSSGIFFVGFIFLVVSIFDISRRKLGVVTLKVKFLLSVLGFLVLYFSFIFLEKNISYFSEQAGGALAILSHGLGFLLLPGAQQNLCGLESVSFQCLMLSMFSGIARLMLILIFLIGTILALTLIRKTNLMPSIVARGLIISIIGGVFGFTTLFSAIFVIPLAFSSRYKS